MGKLEDDFGVPPFSVLDTRQGYWQERKRKWIALGIESELGRGDDITWGITPEGFDTHGQGKTYTDSAKEKQRGIIGHSPLPLDRAKAFKSQNGLDKIQFGDDRQRSGTSIFDPVLCELMYKWFCPKGGNILDPFAGGSVRGIVAHYLGYTYVGIDLIQRQVDANCQQAVDILEDGNSPKWIVGDSRNIPELLTDDDEFDFVFTCPPYYNLEIYSDLKEDLSNASSYESFVSDYDEIMGKAFDKLKHNRFVAIVVANIRGDGGFYYNLVGDTIDIAEKHGLNFYNDIILVNVIGSLPIRVAKQFEGYRKIGKTHQNILVFFNGDNDKAIPNEIGNVDIADGFLTMQEVEDEF